VTYLALDIGDTQVTAAVWSPAGLVSLASAPLPAPVGPRDLWTAVESAVAALAAEPATDLVAVEAVGCSGNATSYLPLARDGEPLGPASPLAPGDPDPGTLDPRTGWLATPRDFVASLLTGRLATDPTMASATGFFTPGGLLDDAAVRAAGIDPEWLPPQRGSTEVLGDLMLPPARRLGLRSRIPVVTGATSDVCAVEGAGALPVAPLVTYGSPVHVHVPVEPPVPLPLPPGVALYAGGRSYQLYAAAVPGVLGLLDRLASDTGRTRDALVAGAAAAAPASDPLRAAYDTLAAAVAQVVATLAPDAKFLCAAGGSDRCWQVVLPSATGLPVAHRRSGTPVTLGLAMLTATGVGQHLDRDEADPVTYVDEPRP
jgi:sugar (pentulose or hexulose) kinase